MRRPGGLLGQHRLAADEGLVQVDREAEARLQHRVGVVDVVTVVPVAFLHPQARQRLQPGMAQSHRAACLDEPVVYADRLRGRHVQLVAQLAQVGDPDTQHPGVPQVDLAGGPERECRAGHVLCGH